MRFVLNKRGMNLAYREIIFILLNIAVFGSVMFFVFKASTGALVFEQAYAKEVALTLDAAEPGMNITFDFEKGYKIAKKNDYVEKGDKLVKIDEKNSQVIVKLDERGGYKYRYFSENSYKIKHNKTDKKIFVRVKE